MNVARYSSAREHCGHGSAGVAYRAALIELSIDRSTNFLPSTSLSYAPGVWSRIVSAFGSQ